jgi:hypothetical protein
VSHTAQTSIQHVDLDGTDSHSLSTNGIETANGIANDQVALGKATQPFVVTAQIGWQPMSYEVGDRLGTAEYLIQFRRRQTAGVLEKSALVCGCLGSRGVLRSTLVRFGPGSSEKSHRVHDRQCCPNSSPDLCDIVRSLATLLFVPSAHIR